uniref:Uncharacterized protein n=1 Tax=Strongyloides papillosus TaxID=174720 RepID=A0A0N5C820_STREA
MLFDSEKLDKPYLSDIKERRISLAPSIFLSKIGDTSTQEYCNYPLKAVSSSGNFGKEMHTSKNNRKSNKSSGKKRLFKATASSLSLFSNGYLSDALSSVTANISGGSGNSDIGHSRGSSIVVELPTSSMGSREGNPKKKDSVTNRCKLV